ncbi:MAG: hypothetical protein O3C19_04920 [Bacteroidetes bacterium]|nr:hypothetical protein [Bacteroidota bacterium]
MKKSLVALFCVFAFVQCRPTLYSVSKLPTHYIEIGSYGGFAGTTTSYYILPNGQQFITSGAIGSPLTSNEIAPVTAKVYKAMCSRLDAIRFNQLSGNEVGNMTYFVRRKTNKSDHKMQWSSMDGGPPELVSFYQDALNNIKSQAIN